MTHYHYPFLSNLVDHYQAAEPILQRYDSAELQLELAVTQTEANGIPYAAPGQTPTAALQKKGVQVWHYFLPFIAQPGIGILGNPISDPYWFRKRQALEVARQDWQLRDEKDNLVTAPYGKGLPVIDPRIDAYHDWLLDALPTEAKHLRLDVVPYHWSGYLKRKIDDEDLAQGMIRLFDKLRTSGRFVIGNWAWQPTQPEKPLAEWTFPFLEHLDGVMIELPTGVFYKWKWYELGEKAIRSIAQRWRTAGTTVMLFARYNDQQRQRGDLTGAWNDFEGYARYYHGLAQELGLWFGAGDDVAGNATHTPPWFDWFESDEGDDDPGGTVDAAALVRIQMLELTVMGLTARQNELENRIAHLEVRMSHIANAWAEAQR